MQNLKSIAISIAKYRKYCNNNCKISKVLQYLLQNFQSIAISIEKSQSIAILSNTIGTTPDGTGTTAYNNKTKKIDIKNFAQNIVANNISSSWD